MKGNIKPIDLLRRMQSGGINFSAIPRESFLGRVTRLPLKVLPGSMTVPVLQGRLRGMKWIVGSSNHGCWLGSYERNKRVAFEHNVKEGSVVFDLGANVGFYTLLASVLVGERGKVVAFEPVPRNLFYLKSHLRMNRVTNVTVVEAAVWDADGECLFDTGPNNSMGRVSRTGNLRVRVTTIDRLVSNGELPLPTHMKIDVEGAELNVLHGSISALMANGPTIFLATHGKDLRRQCCDVLRSLGYSLKSISGASLEETDEILACPRA